MEIKEFFKGQITLPFKKGKKKRESKTKQKIE